MFTLYFAPGASSMAVHIALHEIGIGFEARPMSFKRNDMQAPDYLAINPEGKVPTLVIDGRPLTEVAAILFYLARRFPEAKLLPRDDLEAEAQALSWMSFIASTLHPARARARLCEASLGHRRPPPREWLGDRQLLDRRHPSVPPVLAACQFAEVAAGDVPSPHRTLRQDDGAAGGAEDDRDRKRSRLRTAGVTGSRVGAFKHPRKSRLKLCRR
ncbi:glutathione S-transferase N-terminal domain-containing protein [Bradyrhizobium sp. CER78]|uniref:glutathione S-transferase family protein n=1 Tax=Bradyrhizobium sp. CER78 TaxID=3039162 RepID=UPI002449810F|nr:glutathione S-transferase N-terminal domain-containing protein [Bradyrhizobium sp. CER78]MDH2386639.1 glutathione S-transferase N-terminal domain-containing protein [Bradyrhizobium sp. CER78]